MAALITRITASARKNTRRLPAVAWAVQSTSRAASASESLPQKPGSGGMPARLSRKVASEKATTGLVPDRPSRSSIVLISSRGGRGAEPADHSGQRCPRYASAPNTPIVAAT